MIRRAVADDAPRMAEISVYGWRNAYRGIVSDVELYGSMRVDRSIERFRQSIGNPARPNFVYVDETDSLLKGILCHGPCIEQGMDDASELFYIYVEPAFMRGGIGASMLGHFEMASRERGSKRLLVWVLEDNAIGRNFYAKFGYADDGARQVHPRLSVSEIRYAKLLA